MDPERQYHAGSRQLQDRFDTRRLADRLAETLTRPQLTDDNRAFIARQSWFFLATADADGFPDCSYKGGEPGFVQTPSADRLEFPSYDGNGMFRSLGNLSVNPRVTLLFIDLESPSRLRVQGRASIIEDGARAAERFVGAQLVIQVAIERVFPNCPRYLHPVRREGLSEYAPRADYTPPAARWKRFDMFKDYLPRGDPAAED